MKIWNYLKSLLPMMKKDTVLEDLRVSQSELKANVMPTYEAAAVFFKLNKIKSEQGVGLANQFYRAYSLPVTKGIGNNIVSEIYSRLPNLAANMDTVYDSIEEILGATVINDGITAKKAALVRAADYMGKVVDFLPDLLTVLYYYEAIVFEAAATNENVSLPAEIVSKVNKTIGDFARLLALYGIDNKSFVEKIANMPDVVLSGSSVASLGAVYREDKLDPFAAALTTGFNGSPIYMFRLAVAAHQANRYRLNKDKKRMLELRLLYLQSLIEKEPDPKIEQEIAYIQNRIDKLEYEMQKAAG